MASGAYLMIQGVSTFPHWLFNNLFHANIYKYIVLFVYSLDSLRPRPKETGHQ